MDTVAFPKREKLSMSFSSLFCLESLHDISFRQACDIAYSCYFLKGPFTICSPVGGGIAALTPTLLYLALFLEEEREGEVEF
jgi:hypothetical protein